MDITYPTTSFEDFSQLPTELQIEIWRIAAQDWVESSTRLLYSLTSSDPRVITYFLLPRDQTLPNLLGATRLARSAMLGAMNRHARGISQEEWEASKLKGRARVFFLHRFELS